MNSELKTGEHDILSFVRPDTLIGALAYLLIFVAAAMVLSRLLRGAVHASMSRSGHIDRTTISFLQQMATALIWIVLLILYAHLIPMLRSMGTALLAGASVASVVIGLAAQSTLGNLVAGVSLTIYRPFRLGDTLQVAAPTGTEIGVVEMISLGYTDAARARGTSHRRAEQPRRQPSPHQPQHQCDLRTVASRHRHPARPRRGSGGRAHARARGREAERGREIGSRLLPHQGGRHRHDSGAAAPRERFGRTGTGSAPRCSPSWRAALPRRTSREAARRPPPLLESPRANAGAGESLNRAPSLILRRHALPIMALDLAARRMSRRRRPPTRAPRTRHPHRSTPPPPRASQRSPSSACTRNTRITCLTRWRAMPMRGRRVSSRRLFTAVTTGIPTCMAIGCWYAWCTCFPMLLSRPRRAPRSIKA